MRASIKWIDNVMFVGHSGSGHSVVIDGPPDAGGKNAGIRPMELMLMGLGACTSFDVVAILKKSRQDITDCYTELEAERAEEVPQVFTRIHVHFVVTGRKLKRKQVERAVALSADKYCSASIMLAKTAEITHDFEIIELPTAD
ncbi:MAG: putative redox protein [Gammaproteobacteria bacterium]|jgi:putative redox protein